MSSTFWDVGLIPQQLAVVPICLLSERPLPKRIQQALSGKTDADFDGPAVDLGERPVVTANLRFRHIGAAEEEDPTQTGGTMRPNATLELGHLPLPLGEGERIRYYRAFPGSQFAALDPYIGVEAPSQYH